MGGMTSSTSTSTPKMPGYVKGLYKDVYQDINRFYNKGKMPVFSEPTTAGLTDQQTGALTGMQSTAAANTGGAGMSGPLQDILNRGGFTAGQEQTIGDMRSLSQNPLFSSTINSNGLSTDQNLVADRYRTGMNEQFGTDANYNRVKQDALDASAQGVNAQAAKMGRFGGGANQNILARAQGSLAANMDTNELDKYRARTDAAAGNLAALGQTGFGNRMGAANAQGALQGQLFNSEQAGIQNMANAYQTMQQPYQTQMGVGNILQQQQQNVINDKMRMFDAKNPMNAYQQFLGLASGMPTGQVQTTSPSTLQMLLGGGLGTMGLLGGLGMFGGGSSATGGA